MITKTALIAAIVFGSASVALASEADPNLLNRYPGYNMTSHAAFQSSNVALTGSHAAVTTPKSYFDRASQSFGGGY